MNRCPGHVRHWFSVYGAPRLRAPVCQRCGEPNPRPLTISETLEFREDVESRPGWNRTTDRDGRSVL